MLPNVVSFPPEYSVQSYSHADRECSRLRVAEIQGVHQTEEVSLRTFRGSRTYCIKIPSFKDFICGHLNASRTEEIESNIITDMRKVRCNHDIERNIN